MRAVAFGTIHVRMIVSLVYRVARKLLAVPAVLLRRDAAKDAELLVLRHGLLGMNAVLASGSDRRWQVWSGVVGADSSTESARR